MEKINQKKRIKWTYLLCFMFFVFAIGFSMFGTVLGQIKTTYQVTISQAGLVGTMQYTGEVIALVLGGMIADRINKINLIKVSFGAFAMDLILMSILPHWLVLLGLFLVVGLCSSLLNMAISSLVSELFQEQRDKYLSILHGCFGVGSLCGPLYPTVLLNFNVSWNFVYGSLGFICALLCIVACFCFSRQKQEDIYSKTEKSQETIFYLSLLKDKRVLLVGIVCFVCTGAQSALNTWYPNYMETIMGVSSKLSGITLTIYWIGVSVGRVGYSFIANKINAFQYVFFSNIVGGGFFLLSIASGEVKILIVAGFIFGALTGGILPICIGKACAWYSKNAGSATTMMCLCASSGGVVFPWGIGMVAQYLGYTQAVLLVAINTMLGGALIMLLITKKQNKKEIIKNGISKSK